MAKPNEKLGAGARREMILRALAGESPTRLAREYGVSRGRVYAATERVRENPGRDLAEAEAEAGFWREVVGMVED